MTSMINYENMNQTKSDRFEQKYSAVREQVQKTLVKMYVF